MVLCVSRHNISAEFWYKYLHIRYPSKREGFGLSLVEVGI